MSALSIGWLANVLVFFSRRHIVSVPLKCQGGESSRSEEGELVGS